MIIDHPIPHLTPLKVKIEDHDEVTFSHAYYNTLSCVWHYVEDDQPVKGVVKAWFMEVPA